MRKRASTCPAPVLDEMVTRVLDASPRPLSAYHIADRLEGRRGASQVASVYRSLERLMRAERVERVETLSAFRIADPPGGILLICEECGTTRILSCPQTRKDLTLQIHGSSFRLDRLVIEAVGRCAQCHEGNASS
jgi:Fur family zinc uptake transcriptional regulator